MTAEKQDLSKHEPDPVHNDGPSCWQLVISDMKAREEYGRKKYKTVLQPNNGRDALVDAYQEILDLAVYLKTEDRRGED